MALAFSVLGFLIGGCFYEGLVLGWTLEHAVGLLLTCGFAGLLLWLIVYDPSRRSPPPGQSP